MSVIQTIADAITRQEGYSPGTRGYRNNNPGNLRDVWTTDGRWYIWPELPHDDQWFPVFPTPAAGRAALEHDLQLKIDQGFSLRDIIYAWAPPSENRTDIYLQNVTAWTGLPVDEALFAYAGGSEGQGEFSTSTAAIIIGVVVAAYALS